MLIRLNPGYQIAGPDNVIKSSDDRPFEYPDDKAKPLIQAGIAVRADGFPEPIEVPAVTPQSPEDPPPDAETAALATRGRRVRTEHNP